MKIERAWLRISVSVVVAIIVGFALYIWGTVVMSRWGGAVQRWFFLLSIFSTGPIVATVLAHMLTPKERLVGHTRCGKCGYILKGSPNHAAPSAASEYEMICKTLTILSLLGLLLSVGLWGNAREFSLGEGTRTCL